MSQAQPLPPGNGGGRVPQPLQRRAAAARAARRRGDAGSGSGASPGSGAEARNGTPRPAPSRAGGARPGAPQPGGLRRLLQRPLLTFALGLGCGYGIAGPLPALVGSTVVALQKTPAQLEGMVKPLTGLGDSQVLVLGMDKVGDNTDVIFTVQVKDGSTTLLQVPRDTFVETERFGPVKANALFAFGGISTAKRELSTLLDAPVDRYLRVKLQAVQRVADALGGVEVDVPRRLFYVDNAQDLYINLYPGRQLLRGRDLEGFLRFRNDEMGDLGRMERQRLVLRKVFEKLIQPGTLTRLPELLQIAGEDIHTDLSPLELGQLVTAMATTEFSASQLPGRLFWYEDLSFWMPASNPHYGRPPEEDASGVPSSWQEPHAAPFH